MLAEYETKWEKFMRASTSLSRQYMWLVICVIEGMKNVIEVYIGITAASTYPGDMWYAEVMSHLLCALYITWDMYVKVHIIKLCIKGDFSWVSNTKFGLKTLISTVQREIKFSKKFCITDVNVCYISPEVCNTTNVLTILQFSILL